FSGKRNIPFTTISQENVEANMNMAAGKEEQQGKNFREVSATCMLLPQFVDKGGSELKNF
ncbi:hypothetical protein, partial [Peribacillus simplex]|uniref:hypothetical protein n=1 Tax=Peribacillus simplex TaxID=1478 RepID=UPI0019D4F5D9